ncbi:MAG: ThiF family adenylyltransferase [Coriobacteriales bacterium]|jgi:tRNA A37 threonylcarbamoyladenosine dehydratase/predicted GIY-YIG superfamily endonuclease
MAGDSYYTYILLCEDDSLYTGITNDVVRRMFEHITLSDACAKYTRSHKAVGLVALWECPDRPTASALEYRIKRLRKSDKLKLVDDPTGASELLGCECECFPVGEGERQSLWESAVEQASSWSAGDPCESDGPSPREKGETTLPRGSRHENDSTSQARGESAHLLGTLQDDDPSSQAGGESTSKLEVIIGREGVEKLASSKVMVIGVGGVGSNCAEALARGGIGNIVIVDHDVVSESNINRQVIAFHSTLGQRKVDVMEKMILDINPNAHVEKHSEFLLAKDLEEFFGPYLGKVDWVVDAIDTISTKLQLALFAQENGLPLVSSMGGGNKLHPEYLKFADLYDTVNCPMCRIMRKEGRKRGIRSLNVLYSSEVPARTSTVEGASRRDRSDLGTMSYFPPIMGQMLAGWVIRQILQIDDSANHNA